MRKYAGTKVSSKKMKKSSTSRLANAPTVAASSSRSHPRNARERWRSGAPTIAIGTVSAASTTSSIEIPSTPLRQTRPIDGASGWVAVNWKTAPPGV